MTTRQPTVFAAQEPMTKGKDGRWRTTMDVSDLQRFGSVRYVYSPGGSRYAVDVLRERAEAVADEYNPETDYVVALGSPTLIALIAWAMGERNKTMRVLEWQRNEQRYTLLGEQSYY